MLCHNTSPYFVHLSPHCLSYSGSFIVPHKIYWCFVKFSAKWHLCLYNNCISSINCFECYEHFGYFGSSNVMGHLSISLSLQILSSVIHSLYCRDLTLFWLNLYLGVFSFLGNDNASLIYFSNDSLFVCNNTTEFSMLFCTLQLYWMLLFWSIFGWSFWCYVFIGTCHLLTVVIWLSLFQHRYYIFLLFNSMKFKWLNIL